MGGWSPRVQVAYLTPTLGQSNVCPSVYDGMSPQHKGFVTRIRSSLSKIFTIPLQITYINMIYAPYTSHSSAAISHTTDSTQTLVVSTWKVKVNEVLL